MHPSSSFLIVMRKGAHRPMGHIYTEIYWKIYVNIYNNLFVNFFDVGYMCHNARHAPLPITIISDEERLTASAGAQFVQRFIENISIWLSHFNYYMFSSCYQKIISYIVLCTYIYTIHLHIPHTYAYTPTYTYVHRTYRHKYTYIHTPI